MFHCPRSRYPGKICNRRENRSSCRLDQVASIIVNANHGMIANENGTGAVLGVYGGSYRSHRPTLRSSRCFTVLGGCGSVLSKISDTKLEAGLSIPNASARGSNKTGNAPAGPPRKPNRRAHFFPRRRAKSFYSDRGAILDVSRGRQSSCRLRHHMIQPANFAIRPVWITTGDLSHCTEECARVLHRGP